MKYAAFSWFCVGIAFFVVAIIDRVFGGYIEGLRRDIVWMFCAFCFAMALDRFGQCIDKE